MTERTTLERDRLFKLLTRKITKYFRHNNIGRDWVEVDFYKRGGFFKGKVLSESDFNFIIKPYTVFDIYTVLLIIAELIIYATSIILTNASAVKI